MVQRGATQLRPPLVIGIQTPFSVTPLALDLKTLLGTQACPDFILFGQLCSEIVVSANLSSLSSVPALL